ncbi:MAG: GNAT family N-acetyltransferase [Spirochaetales bacterium]|jgi:GNAT superfamily N-acetyltransferase|nr:GNAT family N-acetyltransferase [Spirochaetales bacterium]
MNWTFAKKKDLHEITAFLTEREWECAALTGRLRRGGKPHFPGPGEALIALRRVNGRVRQVLYMSKTGFVCPYFPELPLEEIEAGKVRDVFFAAWGLVNTLIGLRRHVQTFAAWMGIHPSVSVDYYLMKADARPPAPVSAELSWLKIRQARREDFEALLPLQEAYEREEILFNQNDFNMNKTRKELKLSLKENIIYLASCEGTAVAKGGTNARGFTCDQIGGVFTHPDFRGRKIARLLMYRLLEHIFAGGKRACLFVKTHNLPALRLYDSLGFRIAENYRISYF